MVEVRHSIPCEETKRLELSLSQQTYSQQYASIYFARLTALRPRITEAASKKWPDKQRLERVLDVKSDEDCWVVATAYMTTALKPNVMNDVTQLHTIVTTTEESPYVSTEDAASGDIEYALEDDYGRIDCSGSFLYDAGVVTGVVLAVLGHEDEQGRFVVVDVCFPGIFSHSIPMTIDESQAQPEYIAAVSGLGLSNDGIEGIQVHQLVDFLRGTLPHVSSFSPSSIKRLIILGNCLAPSIEIADSASASVPIGKKKVKRYGYDTSAYNPNPTFQLDNFLDQVCSSIDVTLMPGPYDYSSTILPQQPLHPALLTKSKVWLGSSLQTVTNPTWLSLGNHFVLATSGQNINDLRKYHPKKSSLQCMENTLLWNHITPTSPDTLWCYPFTDKDTFVMEEMPDLYLCGNQPKFGCKTVVNEGNRIQLVSVPEFRKTGVLVLINMHTLNVEIIQFRPMSVKAETPITS